MSDIGMDMLQKKARILLVEDDEDDFIIARDCIAELEEYHFTVDWVSTPSDALDQLKLNQHEICLLDYQLGALTGLTVLEKANEVGSRVPIIMLTGQSDKVLDKAALDAGAVDFIVKNELDSPRFARSIRYAIARQEVEKERLERINIETQSRTKDRFLAHLSHELRTPLTSILGYTELLLSCDKAAPVTNELNIILNNGKHLLSLLNDVLDLSKIAANKLELTQSTINLNSFLVDIYTLIQVSADDKGIDLRLTSTTSLPQEIQTDPTRLRQILINLIYNALKFTEKGSVSISVRAEVKDNNCILYFSVADTGQGIPADKIATIFKPFEQVEDIISRKEVGAGLGLAISSELAKKLKGEIAVTSTEGKGSCFTLALKCEGVNGDDFADLSFVKKVSTHKNTPLKPLSGKVLVVDDLPDIRMLIGHFIRSFDLTVEFASNGREALEKVILSIDNGLPYDAVIMDIHMPEMNGKEAVVAIREQGFHKQILALTAATMKGVKENLQTLGFDYVISKPIDKMQLYHYLARILKNDGVQPKVISRPEVSDKPSKERLNFLLVEDDVDAAEITKLLLGSLGVNVVVAHSGKDCRQLLGSVKHWDKVLLDVHLPDENGLHLAKFISSQKVAKQIVITSGEEIDQASIKRSGSDYALLKPLNKKILSQLVEP